MSNITPVGPIDSSKKNSKMFVPSEDESTVVLTKVRKVCDWNDQEFPEGANVCDNGATYECSFGKWVKTGQSC